MHEPARLVVGTFRFLSRSRRYGRTVSSLLDGGKQFLISFRINHCDLWPRGVRRFTFHPVHKRQQLFFRIEALLHDLSRATQLHCPFVQKHTSEVRECTAPFSYIETFLVHKAEERYGAVGA